ncbi:MAG: phage portal protein, partial [Coriobacteriaceae bacterium]|nr:phage portal protein [Coriobacteriaceae bacterium]
MRDVLRMEVGAEFFTAPQRYILGADPSLFAVDDDSSSTATSGGSDDDDDAAETLQIDQNKLMKAYLGQILAITRDPNGDVPQVGQFPAGDAQNFIAVFENDAQRFSGATNVPLAQLGVLSNTYTSSDALSATNDPLILDVEAMNRRNKASMEKVGRLMLAIARGTTVGQLGDDGDAIIAHFADPSMPTFAARADGWTKIGASDTSIVGGRVWYEGMGMPRETIDRIMAEKDSKQAQAAYNLIFANTRTEQPAQPGQQAPEPESTQPAEVSGE